jgi:hypothetical protein
MSGVASSFRRIALNLAAATTAVVLFGQAVAASAEIKVSTADGLSLIFITGPFEPGDHVRFVEAVLPVRSGVVVLGSGGGSLQAGIEIGKAIRLKDFATYVPPDVVCASACALAWLGGTSRLMASSAQIGFHAVYRIENGTRRESGVGNALVGAYVNSLGLSERAIRFISSADPAAMQWLTLENASRVGIEVARFDLPEPKSAGTHREAPLETVQPSEPIPRPPPLFDLFGNVR